MYKDHAVVGRMLLGGRRTIGKAFEREGESILQYSIEANKRG